MLIMSWSTDMKSPASRNSGVACVGVDASSAAAEIDAEQPALRPRGPKDSLIGRRHPV